MVILIGGSSCTGKTLLANQLMKEQGISYFSIDYLKMGLYRSDEACGFSPLSDIELIASKLWPILREMIKTYIENHIDIVIEGCYILPQFLDDFDDEYIEEIYSVFLGFSKAYISNNFESKILGYKGAIEYRSSEDDRTVDQFIKDHSELKALCHKTGREYFEVESEYMEEMKKLKLQITSRLSKAAVADFT